MDIQRLTELLEAVQRNERSLESVAAQLVDERVTPVAGCSGAIEARVDHERAQRCGYAEVIFAEGKTGEQVASISSELLQRTHRVLATRATPQQFELVKASHPKARFHTLPRIISIESDVVCAPSAEPVGLIVVASAGTADLPVAEEAAFTAEALGARVERLYDVGVAGVHRALSHTELLREARVVIAVAGMEGALPSLIAGLVGSPVVAVPTSVGYGANLDGFAPLLTMLNSCAGGIGVVNIDNGFGAAVLACKINDPIWDKESPNV